MKVFTATIPHSYTTGKSNRKITTNAILSMSWQKRMTIHDQMLANYYNIFKAIPQAPHANHNTYRISLGFHPGKSTRNVDIDNFSIILKYAIDAWKKCVPFDDSITFIREVRMVVLPKQDKEKCVFQVEQLDGIANV